MQLDLPNRRLTTSVFKLGETEPFFILVSASPDYSTWSETQRLCAEWFDVEDREDIGVLENEDGVELLTIKGKPVGSFDIPVEA